MTQLCDRPAWGQTDIAPAALRQVLGSYATGVAVVSTRAADGRPVGLTINSFASLSLAPPLVLWSLVNHSPSLAAFATAPHFAISVLAHDQQALARRFASAAVADKFDGVAVHEAPEGVPVIDDALATLVCARDSCTPAGDHQLFIGQVLRMQRGEGAPLVFQGGRFVGVGEVVG
ncbi:flavin reductase family protein [Ideonella sp. DXS22W]|uniref:Flavin reductase family protein n=1 Tax=Pseudaquabacterium inlustre TaxID=2984192 RepID=A0ABU9CMR4_9BURK